MNLNLWKNGKSEESLVERLEKCVEDVETKDYMDIEKIVEEKDREIKYLKEQLQAQMLFMQTIILELINNGTQIKTSSSVSLPAGTTKAVQKYIERKYGSNSNSVNPKS